MSDKTEINEFLNNRRNDSKSTEINPDINNVHRYDSKATEINPDINNAHRYDSKTTEINDGIMYTSSLIGKTIKGYTIIQSLSTSSGEADVYVCKSFNNEYVLKLYRRVNSVKKDIIHKLMKIDSPYVAKIIDYGEYNGLTFVILPYFKYGSLEGKNYSEKRLFNTIIPDINEGLHVLHQTGIIHKDIKPSNIMIRNDRSGVSTIDFGISSLIEEDQYYVVTHTGCAPAFTDPDAFIAGGAFRRESDYYSLGITAYALYTGHAPYEGMSQQEIARYRTIQKLPFPSTMPKRLVNLIKGLTYGDLTNQDNPVAVNRRWTYSEVKRFLGGEDVPVPDADFAGYRPYTFLDKSYSSMEDLVDALGNNWNDGKRQLYRGLLSGYLKPLNPQLAEYCLDAEASRENNDKVFFNLLFKLNPNLKSFHWLDRSYPSLKEFGKDLLQKLWNKDTEIYVYSDSVLTHGIVSDYLVNTRNNNEVFKNAVAALEHQFNTLNKNNFNSALFSYYSLAYLISDKKILNINGKEFKLIPDLISYINLLISYDYEKFVSFTNSIIDKHNKLDPQFEAWLVAIGKRKEMTEWVNSIK